MSEPHTLPQSGYSLERVYATHIEYKTAPPAEDAAEVESNRLSFGWDWRIVGADAFDVSITLQTHPTKQRAESIHVSLVGSFRRAGEKQTVDASRFVTLHGPALLLPYAREVISSLSGRGFHGPLLIPPVNVHVLMAGVDTANSTGAKQLAEDPSLALGFFPVSPDAAAQLQAPKEGVTGNFVTKNDAMQHPGTTQIEPLKKPKKK